MCVVAVVTVAAVIAVALVKLTASESRSGFAQCDTREMVSDSKPAVSGHTSVEPAESAPFLGAVEPSEPASISAPRIVAPTEISALPEGLSVAMGLDNYL